MSAPTGDLSLDVYNSGYKPIPSALPEWPEEWQATWPSTTSTLICGHTAAVLVDSLATTRESDELASWVRARGKNLTAVYITHAHADHFFGLSSVLLARVLSRPAHRPSGHSWTVDQQ
jgi:glyoxylase-like metal-dependent hydrolase (beta-lactamase superfamily II)